jgi:mannose-6-phosphate isomerase-like protein (cupin superfamily)
MPRFIAQTTRIQAAGNKPKVIDEFIGRVNSADPGISIAHMRSPPGWAEPGQCPEFTEYTIVISGTLRVEHESGSVDVNEGQAVVTSPGEWVRYSTPFEEGAEYIAICVPAFSPDMVHREPS